MSSTAAGPADPSRVVEAFAAGWRQPHPHAWDELLAAEVELAQPLLRSGRGLALWQAEVARLLTFVPDLTGHVLSWAHRQGVVFVEIELTGTVGGVPLTLNVVDRLELSSDGVVLRRDSFFDPLPVAVSLLGRPRAWLTWWHSGVGRLFARRRFLTTTEVR